MLSFVQKFKSLSYATQISISIFSWLLTFCLLHLISAIISHGSNTLPFILYVIVSYWISVPFLIWFILPKIVYRIARTVFDAKKDSEQK